MNIIRPQRRFEIFQRDGFRCVYCGRTPGNGALLQLDHKEPRVLGGTDDDDNLVTSCSRCNLGKKDRPLDSPEQMPNGLRPVARHQAIPLGKVPDWMAWCASGCFDCSIEHVTKGCYTVLPIIYVDHDQDYRRFALGYRCPCGHLWHAWWDARYAPEHAALTRDLVTNYPTPHFPDGPQW